MNASSGTGRYQALADSAFAHDYPTPPAARQLEDELYFQRAVQVYHWALPAMNISAKTLITTPNSDVIYGVGFLDLAKDGPIVIEAPPKLQALIDDFWHRPIAGPTIDGHTYYADIGLPGPDKGKGGRYLILPPHFDGTVPDSGYYIYRSRTNGVFVFLRGFFQDPKVLGPAVENMEGIRIYPFGKEKTAEPTTFPDASGKPANLLAPADGSYFDLLDRFIQSEVVDPEDRYMRGAMRPSGPSGDSRPAERRRAGTLGSARARTSVFLPGAECAALHGRSQSLHAARATGASATAGPRGARPAARY